MTAQKIFSIKNLTPRFKIHPFKDKTGTLARALKLKAPPLEDAKFRQISYIENHLRNHEPRKCRSMIIEQHYIDRSFMEDYNIFYSSSLKHYPNWCRRVHFFSLDPEKLELAINQLLESGRSISSGNSVENRKKKKTLSMPQTALV
jgi:hypothetical protein